VAAIVPGLLFLWRFKLGLLLLFAMLGEAPALALVLLVPVPTIVACATLW
jgi:hypothetical protein